ncbi:MAG: hypothetical protein DHS20C11_08510 [Lysobacteraceae bacterium]|nr:MAG: hypothetical protein DHS20C11_08510 [Xanthomonadaceae bacterium]
MKKHPDQKPKHLNQAQRDLCEALATLRDAGEIETFMEDLCTPAELEALVDRWRVVRLLQEGLPYRKIHDISSVSVTTIGRVARFLEQGAGGYRLALSRLADD